VPHVGQKRWRKSQGKVGVNPLNGADQSAVMFAATGGPIA
jgi:hypothetical protein